MKHLIGIVGVLILSGLFAACGGGPTNPLGTGGSTAGSGVTTGGSGTTTGGSGVTTGGTGVTTGGTTTTGGGCKPGGSSCQSFQECCSGTCANQVCTSCGSQGQPCGQGCCEGLTCFNGTCGSCAGPGDSCNLASECCSNICTQGTCASCSMDGDACDTGQDCCSGTCTAGNCGICNPNATCANTLFGTDKPEELCDGPKQYYEALHTCTCVTKCAAQCATSSFCANGGNTSQACVTCLTDANMGCSKEGQDCAAN